MKTFKKIIIFMGIFILIISLIGAYIFTPLFRISSQEWLQKSTSEEIRKNAHKVLKYFHSHEAYLVLMDHGNKDSIPYLLDGIKEVNNQIVIECTFTHCKDALVKITGQDYGYDYKKWKENINR